MNLVAKAISFCGLPFVAASFVFGQMRPACPIQAVNIVPHVYTFRNVITQGPEKGGWRPFNVMAMDLTVRNSSENDVAAMWFDFVAPNDGSQLGNWDSGVHVPLRRGQQVSVYFDNYGRFMNLWASFKAVKVMLTKIMYASGQIVDLTSCEVGTAPIPPPFQPPKAQPDSPVYDVGGDVSPPRVLEWHLPPVAQPLKPKVSLFHKPTGSTQKVIFSLVVGEDGEPRNIQVKEGTLGDKTDEAKETLRRWYFAPAMRDDTPVAVRIEVSFSVVHTPQGGFGWGASRPYAQTN